MAERKHSQAAFTVVSEEIWNKLLESTSEGNTPKDMQASETVLALEKSQLSQQTSVSDAEKAVFISRRSDSIAQQDQVFLQNTFVPGSQSSLSTVQETCIGTLSQMQQSEKEQMKLKNRLKSRPEIPVSVNDFTALYTEFHTQIVNFIQRMVNNREEACDLTQDVFIKVYRFLSNENVIAAGAFNSWLYRIAKNTTTDTLRRKQLIQWLPLSLFQEDRSLGEGMFGGQTINENDAERKQYRLPDRAKTPFEETSAEQEIIKDILSRIPQKDAACLLLYENEGFSTAEIAEKLHSSPSAIKMRLMRAREKFAKYYKLANREIA